MPRNQKTQRNNYTQKPQKNRKKTQKTKNQKTKNEKKPLIPKKKHKTGKTS